MSSQIGRSSPNGKASTPTTAQGMTTSETSGTASALPRSPNGLRVWKWKLPKGAVARLATSVVATSAKPAKASQRTGAADGAGRLGGREAAARPFRGGDEGGDGRIRHLEARAEQRFGLARQHDERRQRQVAHAQRRPVDEDRAEHDEGHDQRPLGRHLGPGEDAIGGRAEHGDRGGDLLHRPQQRERRDRGEKGARQPEDGSRRQHHVQAGDRDDVVDAGGAQSLVGVLVDQPALAGDERRRDGAGLAADRFGDAAREIGARRIHRRGEAKRKVRGNRRRLHGDAPGQRADRADPAEISVAGEIVAARPRRLGRRQQARVGGDEVARLEALPVAQADAHALRTCLGRERGEVMHAHDDARARVALVDALDEAAQRADDRAAEHRRLDGAHAHDAGGEAEEQGGAAERDGQARRGCGGRRWRQRRH